MEPFVIYWQVPEAVPGLAGVPGAPMVGVWTRAPGGAMSEGHTDEPPQRPPVDGSTVLFPPLISEVRRVHQHQPQHIPLFPSKTKCTWQANSVRGEKI